METSIARAPDLPRPVRALACACACALAVAAMVLVAVTPARAATYDPLNVISYETWRGSSAMSTADIQAFLDTLSGPLKSYTFVDTITAPKAVRRTAASIIWRCAQSWNLNPRVILATLQKEQSLLTVSNSDNAARLVKAMGCGVYGDANHDGKTDNRFPGFVNQIWNGARVLSTYEVTYGWYVGKPKAVTAYKTVDATKTVDGVTVSYHKDVSYTKYIVPKNACTFALYTYTPYYPQINFWNIYVRYFGDPLSPPRMLPVYRFRSRTNGNYYYTASEAKRYTLVRHAARSWTFEGVSLTVDTSATANVAPLYRIYNSHTHKYAYTTSPAKRDGLLRVRPKQWRYDGIVCNVSLEASGTAPVFRLERKTTHGSLLTASESKKRSLTTGHGAPFYYRGVSFRLDASDVTTVPVGPTP